MTRFNKLLIGLFAVQILLAVGIYIGSQPLSVESMQRVLLDGNSDQVNQITIEGADGKQVQLTKADKQWQLTNYHQLSADQNKIEQALANLSNTKSGWPVATTSSSQARFEVSDEKYQTRITLADGDKEQQLYLGTSPGFKQVHLRKAGEDNIYTVKLNSYDFPVEANEWLDRTLVQPEGDITSLEGPGFSISKQGSEWQLPDGKGTLVKEELNKLVNALKSLSVLAAVEKVAGEPEYSLSVKSAKKSINYHFFSQEDNHYLSHDGYSQAFKISKSDYEKITGQTPEKLVRIEAVESDQLTAGKKNEPQPKDNS